MVPKRHHREYYPRAEVLFCDPENGCPDDRDEEPDPEPDPELEPEDGEDDDDMGKSTTTTTTTTTTVKTRIAVPAAAPKTPNRVAEKPTPALKTVTTTVREAPGTHVVTMTSIHTADHPTAGLLASGTSGAGAGAPFDTGIASAPGVEVIDGPGGGGGDGFRGGNKLSAGAAAGIVIGVLLGAAILMLSAALLVCRKRRRRARNHPRAGSPPPFIPASKHDGTPRSSNSSGDALAAGTVPLRSGWRGIFAPFGGIVTGTREERPGHAGTDTGSSGPKSPCVAQLDSNPVAELESYAVPHPRVPELPTEPAASRRATAQRNAARATRSTRQPATRDEGPLRATLNPTRDEMNRQADVTSWARYDDDGPVFAPR